MTRKRLEADDLKGAKYEPTVKRSLSIRIPKSLDKKLFRYVFDNNLNMSALLNIMIKNYFDGIGDEFIPTEAKSKKQRYFNTSSEEINNRLLIVEGLIEKTRIQDQDIIVFIEKWINTVKSIDNNLLTDEIILHYITDDLLNAIKINHNTHLINIYQLMFPY